MIYIITTGGHRCGQRAFIIFIALTAYGGLFTIVASFQNSAGTQAKERGRIRMIRNISAAFICIVFLTGCSWLDDWPPGNGSAERSSVRIVESGAGTYHAEQGRALPPPYVRHKGQDGAAAGGLEGSSMTEPREVTGLDLTPLHDNAPVSSAMPVEERLAILEEHVMQIQSMMSRMQPAMERFAGLEDSLQRLLHDMEGAVAINTNNSGGEYGHDDSGNRPENLLPVSSAGTDTATATAMPGQHEEVLQDVKADSAAQKGAVRQLRIGEHPDKTRIVMDATAGLDFNIHNENQGRVLIVDLPAAGWDTAASMQAANSPLIESYQSQPDGNGGTRLFLSLKKDVRVLWAEALAPVGGKGHRIVIDLAGA